MQDQADQAKMKWCTGSIERKIKEKSSLYYQHPLLRPQYWFSNIQKKIESTWDLIVLVLCGAAEDRKYKN